jgi:7,8-dihydroneopterin aldolase/epimerase/oxygenase
MNIQDELQLTCRKLFLRDYELSVSIGVHDFEKAAAQRILFNVDAYVLLNQSISTNDDLEEVLDYDFIRDAILKRATQGHIQLQETLCDDIVAKLFAHPKIKAIRVSTEKPDVYPDSAAVGVEVFKIKP